MLNRGGFLSFKITLDVLDILQILRSASFLLKSENSFQRFTLVAVNHIELKILEVIHHLTVLKWRKETFVVLRRISKELPERIINSDLGKLSFSSAAIYSLLFMLKLYHKDYRTAT